MTVQHIVRKPLHEIVYNELKSKIMEGEFRPGARLNQLQLAEQFGVSRMPVRDALRMLENEKLIVNDMDKGFTVATFSNEKIKDILFVRSILEENAVLFSQSYVTPEFFANADALLLESNAVLQRKDLEKMRRLNENFHFMIYDLVPSPTLHDNIYQLWHSYPKYLGQEEYDRRKHSLLEHTRILTYMKENNFSAAGAEMRSHILNSIS